MGCRRLLLGLCGRRVEDLRGHPDDGSNAWAAGREGRGYSPARLKDQRRGRAVHRRIRLMSRPMSKLVRDHDASKLERILQKVALVRPLRAAPTARSKEDVSRAAGA
jgi:hypothetical protein